MKIEALIPFKIKKFKVKLYKLGYIDILLHIVISNRITNWTSNQIEPELPEIRLKSFPKKIKGIIVYNDLEDLTDFLLEEYIPQGNFAFDKFLKDSQKLSRKKRKNLLLETLIRYQINNDPYVFDSFQEHIFYYKHKERRQTKIIPFINLNILPNIDSIVLWESIKGYILFKKAFDNRIIYVNEFQNISGKMIPRTKFLILADAHIYWNGKSVKIFSESSSNKKLLIEFGDKREYNKFEKYAQIKKVDREYIPPKEFNPQFLLRVPSKKEIKNISKIQGKSTQKIFNKPFFIYDARGAIELPENLPVIDSLNKALNILSRAPHWIAIPEEAPSLEILNTYSEEKPYYVVCGEI